MTTPCFIIAEAGVNHDGSPARALELAEAARTCGADAVKYQTFRTDRLTTRRAATCAYQETATGGQQSQQDMLRALELPDAVFRHLARHCQSIGIEFMSTAFDPDSLDFLVSETGIRRVKIPSGELVNPLLLLRAARTGLPVILSTGMATLDEVAMALGVLAHGLLGLPGLPRAADAAAAANSPEGAALLAQRITLLHCVSDYPAPPQDSNLRALATLRNRFTLPVGLSDHTEGTCVAVAAVALGAVVLEKHFTLDQSLPGPDHRASLDVAGLARLVEEARIVESALGDGVKAPRPSEVGNIAAIRGSLVATRNIRAGDRLDDSNITVKRPGDGLPPMRLLDLAGSIADRDFAPDEQITVPLDMRHD
ncbi:N-acetylneuraminate synthase [Asticcacaulis sp.]|uniref:N-acetylneuraminate synthase n=1 Tax=Asticcacaulis sp. TaxID=1872648 RepID=UPI00261CB7D0|nr:N-acetylneuraminate synthase [Asticcacaulis sp.]